MLVHEEIICRFLSLEERRHCGYEDQVTVSSIRHKGQRNFQLRNKIEALARGGLGNCFPRAAAPALSKFLSNKTLAIKVPGNQIWRQAVLQSLFPSVTHWCEKPGNAINHTEAFQFP